MQQSTCILPIILTKGQKWANNFILYTIALHGESHSRWDGIGAPHPKHQTLSCCLLFLGSAITFFSLWLPYFRIFCSILEQCPLFTTIKKYCYKLCFLYVHHPTTSAPYTLCKTIQFLLLKISIMPVLVWYFNDLVKIIYFFLQKKEECWARICDPPAADSSPYNTHQALRALAWICA